MKKPHFYFESWTGVVYALSAKQLHSELFRGVLRGAEFGFSRGDTRKVPRSSIRDSSVCFSISEFEAAGSWDDVRIYVDGVVYDSNRRVIPPNDIWPQLLAHPQIAELNRKRAAARWSRQQRQTAPFRRGAVPGIWKVSWRSKYSRNLRSTVAEAEKFSSLRRITEAGDFDDATLLQIVAAKKIAIHSQNAKDLKNSLRF